MLNLLFISNSPKTEFIINALQPQLKVKIDAVADFDQGLKAVFEKRPATVIIQEQIAGVTGESVARHIQMLLGSGAPSFIMIHEGNARIKPIKGLFEHLIDLTQTDVKLVEDILVILKSMLGPEWDKAVITPKLDPAAIAASIAVPEENRDNADKLVDDFLTDLEDAHTNWQEKDNRNFDKAESATDELARLLVETANSGKSQQKSAATMQSSQPGGPGESLPLQLEKNELPVESVESGSRKPSTKKPTPEILQKISTPSPAHAESISSVPANEVLASEKTLKPVATPPLTTEKKGEPSSKKESEASNPPPSSANFKISVSPEQAPEDIPEDLLLAFEKNYHAQTIIRKRLVLAFVLIAVLSTAGWLLWRQKPHSVSTRVAQKPASTALIQKQQNDASSNSAITHKVVSSAIKTPATADSALSALITNCTRDDSFSAGKPGWERYVGKSYECRFFRSKGQIKAVQVMANPRQTISDAFMNSVLEQLAGNNSFKVNSTEQKHGYLIQSASAVDKKADLLVYRKKKSGEIRAFVVSIN